MCSAVENNGYGESGVIDCAYRYAIRPGSMVATGGTLALGPLPGGRACSQIDALRQTGAPTCAVELLDTWQEVTELSSESHAAGLLKLGPERTRG